MAHRLTTTDPEFPQRFAALLGAERAREDDVRQAVAAINAEEQRRLEMQRAVGDGR